MKSIEKTVREWLLKEQEDRYREFSSSLIPGVDNILGVRIPKLRNFAKRLVKYDYEPFLDHACKYMEETMLQGMLIGLIKETPEEKLKRIKKFLPKITNWSICDSFCCGLKFCKENQKLVWEFICPLINSKHEYDVRFALVMMLTYFIDEDYITQVLKKISEVTHEGYYAKMGAAWAVSICYIKFPKETTKLLETLKDQELKQKSIRKICESYKATKEEKIKLKSKLL